MFARPSRGNSLHFGVGLGFGRPRDREDLAHVLGQHLAKGRGIARQRAPLVPEDRQRLAQRFAPVRHPDNSQRIAMSSQRRRNDRYAVPGFGQRQQRMRCAALEQNVRLEPCETAGGVEGPAKPEPGIQQKQRIRREARHLDCAALAERQRWMARGEQVDRFQRMAREARIVRLNRVKQILTKVNLAAFQHCQNLEHQLPSITFTCTLG